MYHTQAAAHKGSQAGVGSPRPGGTGSCKPSDVGAGVPLQAQSVLPTLDHLSSSLHLLCWRGNECSHGGMFRFKSLTHRHLHILALTYGIPFLSDV